MARLAAFAAFLGVVILILGGLHAYLWLRLIHDPRWPAPWPRVGRIVLCVLGLSLPATFVLGRALPPAVSRVVLFVPYVWMGMMALGFFLTLAIDLLRGLAYGALFASGHGASLDAGRRRLVARGIAAAVAAVIAVGTVVAVATALGPPSVRRLRIEVPDLPPRLSGFTLVQLTDLHLGPTLGEPWLRRVVDEVRALRPDLVVITGDLVDSSVPRLYPALAPLRDLRPPHGTFFVTGNHEVYAGLEEWLPAIERLGIRVLRNERVAIGRDGDSFDLVGVYDFGAGPHVPTPYRPDLPAALAGRDPHRAAVLLAHQPRAVAEAARLGVGLQLSGHTHGGQIWPWRYLVYLQQPFVGGLHRVGPTQVYVSDGTGFWGPPMRLGTRPEITHVTLVSPRR